MPPVGCIKTPVPAAHHPLPVIPRRNKASQSKPALSRQRKTRPIRSDGAEQVPGQPCSAGRGPAVAADRCRTASLRGEAVPAAGSEGSDGSVVGGYGLQEVGDAAGAGEEVCVRGEDAAGVGECCAEFVGLGPESFVVAA